MINKMSIDFQMPHEIKDHQKIRKQKTTTTAKVIQMCVLFRPCVIVTKFVTFMQKMINNNNN